ncbi:MAG: hypothetical protein E4G94_00620 [ANME-2 cluster archaeon]|nr:MAG: hypothetical protein E4G94_00620 [ANME-2 cluster archaeon]
MVLVNLSSGLHTIEWALAGYNTITATIYISESGAVTCTTVTNGSCAGSLTIAGSTITGLLTQISGAGICDWITALGGINSLLTFNIMDLVMGYLGLKEIGFPITTSLIMGAVAYYNDQIASGNSLTGCVYT